MGSWMARAEGGDEFLAPHAGGPFKPLHDLEFALHFEGERRRACSLYREALDAAANKPNPAADALVEDGPSGVTYVEYLRTAVLAWGGFPGWEDAKQVPAELDDLRRDLVPF